MHKTTIDLPAKLPQETSQLHIGLATKVTHYRCTCTN